jgi:hypothetical protein
MNINDRVISVEEFWRGWSSTEALIVILLVVITFLLIQLNSKRRKRPAFTKEEWEEAVATWYEWEFSLHSIRNGAISSLSVISTILLIPILNEVGRSSIFFI